MVRYECRAENAHEATAVFKNGVRLPVHAARDCGLPGLAGAAPDTSEAYRAAASRLAERAVRVADLGCGSGAGTMALTEVGLDVVGIDRSAEAIGFARQLQPMSRFEEGFVECGDALSVDAVTMIDVLGFAADDAPVLRGLARRVRAGTTMIAAVPLADIDQRLTAPARRAYSPEDLDALLVRTGWAPPVHVACIGGMLIVESHRAAGSAAHTALELADSLDAATASESVLIRLATALNSTQDDPALARELTLSIAEWQLARGDVSAADQAVTAAIGIAPRSARALVMMGRVASARGERNDAEALFDHALGIDPCCVRAWTELAMWHEKGGSRETAAQLLACAAALEPADHAIAGAETRLLGLLGDGAGAMRVLDRVLAYGSTLTADLRAAVGWIGSVSMGRGAKVSRRGNDPMFASPVAGSMTERMAS